MEAFQAYAIDVLIVGAGLAGVGVAARLTSKFPGINLCILEQRERIGGTWDLFTYPGVRSDSDMHTLGYSFRPWPGREAIAGGEEIRRYIADTAKEAGIHDRIVFGHKLIKANWISAERCWHATIARVGARAGEEHVVTARFLIMCSGYFDHDRGYSPCLPGADSFAGDILHPQHWPGEFDVLNRNMVVIGSGATAVTLLPTLATQADSVVMLQRSPGYIASRPRIDHVANRLRSFLGLKLSSRLIRTRNLAIQRVVYWLSRRFPRWFARKLIRTMRAQLPPLHDFSDMQPRYRPCEQRLCVVPDGDLFRSVKSGKVRIVTGEINYILPEGIMLQSGELLECDTIVTATGLNLAAFGKAEFSLDGVPVTLSDRVYYKGVMLGGIPNLASVFGYVNISWTVRIELIADYLCRLLETMNSKGATVACPSTPLHLETDFIFDTNAFSAGYYLRAKHLFPRNAKDHPWIVSQDYRKDKRVYRADPIEDGILDLS